MQCSLYKTNINKEESCRVFLQMFKQTSLKVEENDNASIGGGIHRGYEDHRGNAGDQGGHKNGLGGYRRWGDKRIELFWCYKCDKVEHTYLHCYHPKRPCCSHF